MRIRRLVILPIALLLPLTCAVPAAADIGGLSIAPAHFDPSNPATRSYFILPIAPGGIGTEQVRVGNAGQQPLDLYVSAVDGLTGQTSGSVYANRTDPVRKAGAWVTTAVSRLTVPPLTSTLVGFAVHVPGDASPGDHLAGIAVEDANPPTSGTGIAVTTVLRAVIGVLIKVPGPAVADPKVLGWSIGPLTSEINSATLFVDLTDAGGLLVKPLVTVDLRGCNGYHAVQTRQLDTVLPGDEIHYPFPWPDALTSCDYTATITTGSSSLTSTTSLGTGLAGSSPAPKPPSTDASARSASPASPSLAPWIVGLVALNAMWVGILLLLLRRRDRRRAPLSHPTLGPAARSGE